MKKKIKYLIGLSIMTLCVSLISIGCSEKKNESNNQVKTEQKKKAKVRKKKKVSEKTESTEDNQDTMSEPSEKPAQDTEPVDTTDHQPYKEYLGMFPKWIPEEYMPRCHSYFIGDPYSNGNIIYRLIISTGCSGEYQIVFKLEKCKVEKSVDSGNYLNSTTGEDGNLQDNFETTTRLAFDNSICPNLSTLIDGPNNNIPYIIGYVETTNNGQGKFLTAPTSTIVSNINYNPGTSIEHDREYYYFDEVYGEGTYVHLDTSKVKSDDVIKVETNIEPFASEISGQEFKADWNIDKGYYDDLTQPYVSSDVVNGYDYGYKYDNNYDKAQFYDSLLY